jgi:hypothetical protein
LPRPLSRGPVPFHRIANELSTLLLLVLLVLLLRLLRLLRLTVELSL